MKKLSARRILLSGQNFAYIDGANLNKALLEMGWKLDKKSTLEAQK